MNAIERLLGIMKTLRDPQHGCPWDREQTFTSIAPYTLEETYEVLDAIQREDFDDLRGELGDLLFQVVFYAQMASEQERFNFEDICHAISDKLERRHPHIFGDARAETSSDVLKNWEAIKTAERADKAQHSFSAAFSSAHFWRCQGRNQQRRAEKLGSD
ncbi:MazG family protein [Pantoea sp. M_5]|uniref:MazG family protein n=1 Tax=Pantoea sp. M_5 TaxID=2608038 RepID=UPI0016814D7D